MLGIRKPVQLTCTHHIFCKACILKWSRTDLFRANPVCPGCRAPVHFLDAHRRHIEMTSIATISRIAVELQIDCETSQKVDGIVCSWKHSKEPNRLESWKKHVDHECVNVLIKCEWCNLFVARGAMDKHRLICECKPWKCGRCNLLVSFNIIATEHFARTCPRTQVCVFCFYAVLQ